MVVLERCLGLVLGLAYALSEVEDEVLRDLRTFGAKDGKGGVTIPEDIYYSPKRLSLIKIGNVVFRKNIYNTKLGLRIIFITKLLINTMLLLNNIAGLINAPTLYTPSSPNTI